jgi:hypothetical protein
MTTPFSTSIQNPVNTKEYQISNALHVKQEQDGGSSNTGLRSQYSDNILDDKVLDNLITQHEFKSHNRASTHKTRRNKIKKPKTRRPIRKLKMRKTKKANKT